MTRRNSVYIVLSALAILVLLVASCAGEEATPTPAPTPTPTPAPTATPISGEVSLDAVDFAFNPSTVTITVGTKVTWTNTGNLIHTVTASGQFDSRDLSTNQSFSQVFDTPGTYEYVCIYHVGLGMTGKVIVQ